MPQGVEHTNSAASDVAECGVKIPLMPQGVEHYGIVQASRCGLLVKIPLMPQGVEHVMRSPSPGPRAVKIPLMPQGVEHSDADGPTLIGRSGEDSIDAARR